MIKRSLKIEKLMNTKQARLYALPAGQGDCLLFQFENNDGVFRHILVDGGNRTKIEFNKLRKTILEILKEGDDGNIDLLVVTHSDDDHISGVLKILADDELNQKIKKIWFNSEKSISDYFKTSFNGTQRYEILESVKGISKSSRNQDYDLYKLLKNDQRWNEEIVVAGKEEIIENLKITVLSPSIEKLRILNEYWPKMPLTGERKIEKSSSKKGFDHDLSYEEFLNNLHKFEEDTAEVNGSSVALLLEWETKKFLLLSDAHPSVIVESLNKINEGKKIKIDALKVSHHGSRKNTNDELLNLLECENFIISSNANKSHYHPDKEALCRILKNNGLDKTKFYFNYDNQQLRSIFLNEESMIVNFPSSIEGGVCLSYES